MHWRHLAAGELSERTALISAAVLATIAASVVALDSDATLAALAARETTALDPAADKLLMTTAFVLLAWRTQGMTAPIPVWVAILAITRDLVISFYAFASVDRLTDSKFLPSLLGKLSTAMQLISVSLGLLFNALGYRPWMDPFLPEMYWVVAALVLASGIHYFMRATRTHGPDLPAA